MSPKVYVIIVNWNGWEDTLECLESLRLQTYDNYCVVLCDNGSEDDSLERFREWGSGYRPTSVGPNSPLRRLNERTRAKRVSLVESSSPKGESQSISDDGLDLEVTLIAVGENRGFAGGTNVGLRYALSRGDAEYVWLLNNDTVVEPDCLERMVACSRARRSPNTCGSRILFYDNPDMVQALAGNRYNRWTGRVYPGVGRFLSARVQVEPDMVERQLSYISGTSWLLPRSFIEDVGLMDESYFLYYEELDWCVRAGGRYALCYADEAIVYHKEGRSIGSESIGRESSLVSDFYRFRNKLVFTKRHFPKAVVICYVHTFLQALNRLRRLQVDRFVLIVRILLGKREL
jgi:GT2 family glycosyltransferase